MFEHNPYRDFESLDADLQARLVRLAGRLGRSQTTTLNLRKTEAEALEAVNGEASDHFQVPHKRFPKNGVQVIYDATRRLAWI